METATYNQVQELLKKLPETKLQVAYRFLADLITSDTESLSFQESLSLNEKRRIMAQQAKQMAEHYQKRADERQLWQEGDFLKEYSARVGPGNVGEKPGFFPSSKKSRVSFWVCG